jgi:histidyl-tRNA synthetase
MNDILPHEIGRWHRLEAAFRRTAELHGYREIRTPLLEYTSLFVRSIGEGTDVVDKEMYSFQHHSEELTLRPEGTAGAARAYVEHKIHSAGGVARWYYLGPMFRGERPAKGRYRQFYQAGAEVYGDGGPTGDAEMIDMLVGFLRELGITQVEVLVNSLGSGDTRTRYRDALVAYLTPRVEQLSEDSRRRLEKNPLRILDSKAPQDQAACAGAPAITDVLGDDDRAHFEGLQRRLDALGTPYKVDPRLVRGLDYYTRTLFEIRALQGDLGAQSALGGGGRYDTLLKDLGGPQQPCIGFGLGLERILIAMPPDQPPTAPWVYVAPVGDAGHADALVLARDLRVAGIETRVDGRGIKLAKMLARASDEGARFCMILGDDEIAAGVVAVKDLAAKTQESLPRADAVRVLAARLATESNAAPASSSPGGGGAR